MKQQHQPKPKTDWSSKLQKWNQWQTVIFSAVLFFGALRAFFAEEYRYATIFAISSLALVFYSSYQKKRWKRLRQQQKMAEKEKEEISKLPE